MDVKGTPVTSNTPINMVLTSTSDSPAIHTHSRMLTTTDTTPSTDVQSMVTLNTGTVSTPPPLMEDLKDTLTGREDRSLLQRHFKMTTQWQMIFP